MHASDLAGLTALSSRLHDWWFDADAIRSQAARNRIEIDLFARRPRPGIDAASATLIIDNVLAWAVHDDTGIGLVDFGSISCDEGCTQLMIRSNFPLVIELAVRGVQVRLLDLAGDCEV